MNMTTLIILINFSTVLGIGSAVAGPTVNYLLPVTDVCEWVKFFWPASSEEITAVKEFFKTKTRKLEKVRELI